MTNTQLITRLTESDVFKEWKKENEDSYLVHIFIMDQTDTPKNYSVGYYNKDDTITTFEIADDNIQLGSKEEIFKKDDEAVKELDIKKAELAYTQIMEIAYEFQKKEYKNELPNKSINILQNIHQGIAWNVTLVTAAFNTLNMKIDASTGEVLEHKLTSLMSMGEHMK